MRASFARWRFTFRRARCWIPPPNYAVAAGNVETSQRIVDVVFGALAQALPELIPAAGQGTMNNLTFGGSIAGNGRLPITKRLAAAAAPGRSSQGCDGIHVHMSNTLNTPVEALEYAFPIQVTEYRLRRGLRAVRANLAAGMVSCAAFAS